MKEYAEIISITVTQSGEVRFFEVKIPRDVTELIGIETTVRVPGAASSSKSAGQPLAVNDKLMQSIQDPTGAGMTAVNFGGNLLYGDIQLWSFDKANLFYAGELHETDTNLGYMDFSLPDKFTAWEWTHGYKREEDLVKVDGTSTILVGIYRDKTGPLFKILGSYEVKIIIWFNT